RPALMGIVNVTPDSFSDGGRFLGPDAALERALTLEGEGADVVDVGGESARPGSLPVSEEEEIRRVVPVIERIRSRSSVPISIDTTKSAVARRALEAGADMINDISAGRFDRDLLPLAAGAGCPVCLMHMQGVPRSMQEAPSYSDLIGEVRGFLFEAAGRALEAGVAEERILLDPGIGFGKSPMDNVTIIQNLRAFVEGLGGRSFPILLGTSRKSFLGKTLGHEVNQRLEGTLATLAVAVDAGVSILRVHDAAPARRFVDAYLLCRS
nr:dihydropteroate synthase [bacterium]